MFDDLVLATEDMGKTSNANYKTNISRPGRDLACLVAGGAPGLGGWGWWPVAGFVLMGF